MLELILAIIGTVMGLAGFGYAVLRDRTADVVKLADRLARIEVKIDVIWQNVRLDAGNAATILHSPNPELAERDRLLELLQSDELGFDDAERLGQMMEQVIADHDTDAGQRLAAAKILSYLRVWYWRTEAGRT